MIPWSLLGKGLFGAGKVAGGWFMGNLKWIGLGVAAVAVAGIAWKIHSTFQERDRLLEERKMVVANLVQDLTIAEIEKQEAEETIARIEADKRRLEQLYADTVVVQREIRAEIREQKAIFERHDFNRLVQAKPGLIETRANRATQERFDELETAFNR